MNPKILKFAKLWLPVFVWAVIIFLFSANPTTRTSEIHWQDFIIKKSAHVFVFGVLSLLLYRAFINSKFSSHKSSGYTLIVAILYAISDEFHQSFTPGREPTLRDILIDTFAVLVILYLIQKISKMPRVVRVWAKKIELIT